MESNQGSLLSVGITKFEATGRKMFDKVLTVNVVFISKVTFTINIKMNVKTKNYFEVLLNDIHRVSDGIIES